jgi:cation transport ATPase
MSTHHIDAAEQHVHDHHASTGHAGPHSGHQGHDKHAGHDPEQFRRKFWLSLALTLPIVVTSEMVMDWFGYSLDFPGSSWVAPVLGSVVFVYGSVAICSLVWPRWTGWYEYRRRSSTSRAATCWPPRWRPPGLKA